MSKEIKICGKTKKEIRKFYFDGKLKLLISKIQASEKWNDKDIEGLGDYLEKLREEEKGFVDKVLEKFGGKIVGDDSPKPPTVEKLFEDMSSEDSEKLKEWLNKVKSARTQINAIRKQANEAVFKNMPLSKDVWSGWALQIETLKRWLSEDLRVKEQLYHKKICEIIDNYSISRREAEDRAKITRDYLEFRKCKDEFDSLGEIVLICKKRSATEF